jgi:predicted outer membrane repeat protein
MVTIPLGALTYSLTVTGTEDQGRWGDLDVYSGTLSVLTITGVAGITSIDASPLAAQGMGDRVLQVTTGVAPSADIELRDLILRGGRVAGFKGGGIWHQAGHLLLTNCTIFDDQGTDGGGLRIDSGFAMNGGSISSCSAFNVSSGGGAFVQASGAQFTNVLFAGNSAQNAAGLRVPLGVTVDLVHSTFTNNTASGPGGAIDVAGTCTATDCSVSANSANSGGGINIGSSGNFVARRTGIASNTAQFGGGINVNGLGMLDLTECTLDQNQSSLGGGGLSNNGSARLLRCTVSRNSSMNGSGGGIDSFGQLVVDCSTISGNRAMLGSGGGHQARGGMPQMFSSCTFAQNSAGVSGAAIFTNAGSGPPLVGLKSTLVGDNRVGPLPQSFAGVVPLGSFDFNFDSDGTCNLHAPGDQSGSVGAPWNAQLGPLQNNGGPTETHALLFCSPAIDHGNSVTIGGFLLPGDQRNLPYVGQPDAGAFEYALPFQQITPYCFGTAIGCPCSGAGGAGGHGCPSSQHASGALLVATGTASISHPSVVLHGSDMTNSFVLYFQGTTQLNGGLGFPFGDGLRCAGGTVVRLGFVQNVGGASSWPSSASAWQTGHVALTAGATRNYQGWYRDASAFCTSSTFNLTNGVQILWCP